VAGRVFAFVGLGLDDRAADAVEEEPAADQVRGDVVDAPVEEISPQTGIRPSGPGAALRGQAEPAASRTVASASRAPSIWAVSASEPVPPATCLDSSQLPRCSTS
jgi:hypothetical protein